MNIVPMRDLKDTVKIETLCKESGEPVFVTKNGYGSLVVMSIDCYDNLIKELSEATVINEGLEDINNNKVVDGPTVLKRIKRNIEK